MRRYRTIDSEGEQGDRRSLLTTNLDLLDSSTNIVVGRLQETRRADELILRANGQSAGWARSRSGDTPTTPKKC